MFELITDPTDERVAPFRGMRDVQLRGDEGAGPGLFIAESENVMGRALDAGVQPACLFMEQKWEDRTLPMAQKFRAANPACPVLMADPATFKAVTGYEVTRGAVAAMVRPQLPTPEQLLQSAHRVLVLEDIMNATNIGAIFRSAAALGADAVLLTPACHDPLFRRAARVSMGTVFQVPWAWLGPQGAGGAWAQHGMALLHEAGFKVAAMALSETSIPLTDPRLQAAERLALVMGTEGDGLTSPALKGADFVVRIPMAHGVDSLNVAVAAGIALWEVCGRAQ